MSLVNLVWFLFGMVVGMLSLMAVCLHRADKKGENEND